jgi:dihydropyrimidinase
VRDPARGHTISASTQLQRVDYNPYEGRRVAGLPVIVMRRGEIIARERRFVGRPGGGRFLARSPAR